MIAGSFIGGATAEGGGAVAFPVMTLVLHATPAVARDYSFMIQYCGRLKMVHLFFNTVLRRLVACIRSSLLLKIQW